MSTEPSVHARTLVEATRALLSALEGAQSDDEVADLVAAQHEAFDAFSLRCDPDAPRSAALERDIDELLELDSRIVEVARTRAARLLEQSRSMSSQQTVARAFRSAEQAPPRFFTQRI